MKARARRPRILAVTGAFALVAALTVAAPLAASADPTGGITGTVTGSGAALAGVEVVAYQRVGAGADASWSWVNDTTTDDSGAYSFPGLDAGTYTVQFTPATGQNFVAEWWNNQSSQDAAAAAISVDSSVVTADDDLPVGSIVTGKISVPASATAARPEVRLMVPDQPTGYSRWKDADPELTAVAKADGTFRMVGVPAGTYTAYFDDSAWSGAVAPQYYGGTPNISLAKPFAVGAAATATVNAALARGSSVSGKVTDAFGKPVHDSYVRVALKLTVDGKTVWQWGAMPVDPATGAFSEKGLPAGTYAIGYAADSGYADSYYGGGHSFATATNFVLTSGSVKSGANGILLKLLSATPPTITGTRAVGSTLTAQHGSWTTGTAFTYQWFANGVYIAGSTSTHPTFVLTGAQRGTQISVKVTGRKSGFATASRTSTRTVKVALTATPTITGTPRVGSTLTAHPGAWTTGTVFTYRWYANGVLISGATHATFTPTSAQRGKTIKVVVTGADSGYQTISRASASTAAIS